MSPATWPPPPCTPCCAPSRDLFFRLRRRRRLLLDCPMPCWMLCPASWDESFCPIWPSICAASGGPWCSCTSGAFCSELMFPLPITGYRSTFLSHAGKPDRSLRHSQRCNQTGFGASVETVSSCTRTCVLMHRYDATSRQFAPTRSSDCPGYDCHNNRDCQMRSEERRVGKE